MKVTVRWPFCRRGVYTTPDSGSLEALHQALDPAPHALGLVCQGPNNPVYQGLFPARPPFSR